MLRIIYIILFIMLLAISVNADNECLECHGQSQTNNTDAVYIKLTVLKSSVHANIECTSCHAIKAKQEHKGNREVLCVNCHVEEEEQYLKSLHMEGHEISSEAPDCVSCHGGHDILNKDNPQSKINHKNSIAICVKCHVDQHIKDNFEILPEPKEIKAFENSVHGNALLVKGNDEAPACVDCHGSHSILPSDRPDSPTEKTHIAATCGKCHQAIAEEYNSSVHGVALHNNVHESPTCTNCHGEHDIKAHLDPDSKIYAANIPKTCSACHASEKVIGRFGLRADRIETFTESFHGTAIEFGETSVANCSSCHGVHNIFPQSDPRSMIHKDNIAETCGQCHKDLPADFARGEVHTSGDRESSGSFYVRQFYYIFIPIIILAFVIYRFLEYKRRTKKTE